MEMDWSPTTIAREDMLPFRFINQQGYNGLHIAKNLNHHLKHELNLCRQQLEDERRLKRRLKSEMTNKLLGAREVERKNCQRTVNELKKRFKLEQTQSLRVQKCQLEKYFRSELYKTVYMKDCQLHLLTSQSNKIQRESNELIGRERQWHFLQMTKMESNYKRHLHRLLAALRKNEPLEKIQKRVQNALVNINENYQQQKQQQVDGFCSHKIITTTTLLQPSTSTTNKKVHYFQHCYCYRTSQEVTTMREVGEIQIDCNSHLFLKQLYGGSLLETLTEVENEDEFTRSGSNSSNESNSTSNSNSSGRRYNGDEFAGRLIPRLNPQLSLENLVFGDGSQDNCLDEDDDVQFKRFGHSSLPAINTINNRLIMNGNGMSNNNITKCPNCNLVLNLQSGKMQSLENTIQQLKDELKECRDQNELLEFRLLEIQEFGVASQNNEFERLGDERKPVEELIESSPSNRTKKNGKALDYSDGTEVTPEEVMIQYQNHHASVTESRSSCSDCSESLSFQESGIFDSQFAEESSSSSSTSGGSHRQPSPPREPSSEVSQELAILSSQIENLILRLSTNANNGDSTTQESEREDFTTRKRKDSSGERMQESNRQRSHLASVVKPARNTLGKGKQVDLSDTSLELQSCRKHVQELEKRITPYLNSSYINNLEDKISRLLQENRRLEEERAEIEEAENDSRNQCQRLDEILRQVRDKNIILQRELSREKAFSEQLTFQLEEMEERNNVALSQLSSLDSLEQSNFELEESQIELKSTIQFLVQSWPLLCFVKIICFLRQCKVPVIEGKRIWQRSSDHQRQFSRSLHSVTACSSPSCSFDLHTRKHKLRELSTTEPSFKKHRTEKNENACHNETCESTKENDAITSTTQSSKRITTANYEGVTWIEEKEQLGDINKYKKLFESEKMEVVERYEKKLLEMKTTVSEEYENSQRELQLLKEKWNALIKEIEQSFALLNLVPPNLATESEARPLLAMKVEYFNKKGIGSASETVNVNPYTSKGSGKIKGLVATRIQSLFPNEWRVATGNCEQNCPIPVSTVVEKTRSRNAKDENAGKYIFQKLVLHFTAEKEKFESREKTLLSQIEQFKQKCTTKMVHFGVNVSLDNESQRLSNQKKVDLENRITHLLEENSRLQHILSDQEKVWIKLKDIEEENERLTLELTAARHLKKKLDESVLAEKHSRTRVEELEMVESQLKEQILQREAKERKLTHELKQLKEDCDYFHSKSSQLENDFDKQIEEISKHKSEIQQLNAKLNSCENLLEGNEQAFEKAQSSMESQISQLQAHMKILQQELADSECTNGMLREEVLYLEQTLRNALEKNMQSEDAMKILTCQIQEKADTLDTLRRECCSEGRADKFGVQAINDLDVFAKNEGGVMGMARDIAEIQQVVQNCHRCENAAKMLSDVSEQLNALTLMLGGNQENACMYRNSEEHHNLLARCESEEHIEQTTDQQQNGDAEAHSRLTSYHSLLEENKVLHGHITQLNMELDVKEHEILRLQESLSKVGVELCELEKEFAARKNDLKESHLNELIWWKLRCQEKNDIIDLLARRLAHLSLTDSYGYFIEGILKEIRRIRDKSYSTVHRLKSQEETSPQDCNSLLDYFNNERRRLKELLNSCNESESFHPENAHFPGHSSESVDFRVLRRISEDSLLVSWTIPEKVSSSLVDGYEISVNGNVFLRIPKPNRFKAVLFGLNMNEPIALSLKCKGAHTMQESCITFIA